MEDRRPSRTVKGTKINLKIELVMNKKLLSNPVLEASYQIQAQRESRSKGPKESGTSCERLQSDRMLILWKKAVLGPTLADVRSAIAPGDKRVLSASLRRGVTAIWSAVDTCTKPGFKRAERITVSELQKCNGVNGKGSGARWRAVDEWA